MKSNKKSGLKSDVKRKLVTGTIETVLGLGVLAFSLVTGSPLLYMGALLAGSGAFTLGICGLRAFVDKKAAEREAKAEEKRQAKAVENTTEKTVENTIEAQQTQEQQQTQETQPQQTQEQPAQETQPKQPIDDSRDSGMEA